MIGLLLFTLIGIPYLVFGVYFMHNTDVGDYLSFIATPGHGYSVWKQLGITTLLLLLWPFHMGRMD